MNDKARAVAEHVPHLRRYARGLCGDRSDADDLLQETVERALSRLHLWRAGSNMKAWLFAIMHNLHVSNERHRRRMPTEVPLDEANLGRLAVPAAQPGHLRLGEFAAALDALAEEQRQVLLLVGLEGMSYKEAAAVIGVPVGTVMSRLARGREALRRAVDGGDDAAATIRRVK